MIVVTCERIIKRNLSYRQAVSCSTKNHTRDQFCDTKCLRVTPGGGGGGGGGCLGGVEGEERLFLGKTLGVGKLICCFVLKLEYLIFFTAVTYLPILEGDFSV